MFALGYPCASPAQQVVKGGVQQTETLPPGCSGGSYAASGDCDKLRAYEAAGGNDPTCLDLWHQAIALDVEIESLGSPATENSDPSLSRRSGQLAQQLAGIEHQIDMQCRAPAPQADTTTVPADTIAAGPSPSGGDEIGAQPGPGGTTGGGTDTYGAGKPKSSSGIPGNTTGDGRTPRTPRTPPPRPSQPPRPPRPPRPPQPRLPPASCDGPWIRTSYDMDSVVFAGYQTQPILLAALCNRPNTWLVTMSGYQTANVWWACVWTNIDCAGKYGQTTGVQEILATSLGMQDNYSFSLVQQMKAKLVPPGSNIVLAGHSLGGMVAQSLPVNPTLGFSSRWHAVRVLTFGAPVMNRWPLPPAAVRRFATQGYVLGITRNLQIDPVVLRARDWYLDLRLRPPVPFDVPTAGNTTMVGVEGQWALPLLHVSYPKSADLKGYDAMGDSPGASYLQLDSTRMWRLPVGDPFPPAPPGPERGLTAADDGFLQNYARTNKLVIIVRDANPYALRWIGRKGYAPKPKVIKAKTLKAGDCADSLLGLAAARSPSERSYYASISFVVAGPEKCYILSSKNGTRYYSDADLHGVYRTWLPGVGAVDQWRADPTSLGRALNQGFTAPMIQHGPQDDWDQRNSRTVYFNNVQIDNAAYGPLPPATAYLPEGGTAHLANLWQLKEFYQTRGIDWLSIYPNPDEQ